MKKDNIAAKKSLGQNFITDENFLKKLSSLIITDNNSLIIEIGPGKGALTKELIKKKIEQILVIEKDDRLIDNLKIFSKQFKFLSFRIRIWFDITTAVELRYLTMGSLYAMCLVVSFSPSGFSTQAFQLLFATYLVLLIL